MVSVQLHVLTNYAIHLDEFTLGEDYKKIIKINVINV